MVGEEDAADAHYPPCLVTNLLSFCDGHGLVICVRGTGRARAPVLLAFGVNRFHQPTPWNSPLATFAVIMFMRP